MFSNNVCAVIKSVAGVVLLFVSAHSVYAHDYGRMEDGMMRGPGYMGNGPCGGGMMGQGMGGMGMMGMGMMGPGLGMRMMHMLDLDEKQRSKVRDLMREQHDANYKLMGEMMDIRFDLTEAFDKDKVDAAVVDKLMAKMFEKKREMMANAVMVRNKLYGLITKEQKEQLKSSRGGYPMMNDGNYMMHRGMHMDN